MKSRIKGCFAVLLSLLLVGSLLLNLVLLGLRSGKSGSGHHSAMRQEPAFEEELIESGSSSREKIAVIDLNGLISSSVEGQVGDTMVDDLTQKLRQAREDETVKAVILRIDSPGGEVNASDIIYHEVAKTRAVKPVIVYMGSVAASGGYYSAIGGSYIMASDLTITASIGVILQTLNYKDLIQKIGVKAVTFKSGKNKDLLNGARDITPEEEKLVQGLIDETYSKFVGLVAKERKLDVTELRNGIADGRILSGQQALDAKLVDSLGYFEDAVTKAKELGKTKNPEVVRLRASYDLFKLLHLFVKSDVSHIQVQLGPETLRLETGKLYFISTHLFSGL
jgi:protease IV